MVPMGDKAQVKVWVAPETKKRWEDAALANGRKSANQLILEIMHIYLPAWEAQQQAARLATQMPPLDLKKTTRNRRGRR
jgi:hypothetical protein